MTEPDPPDPGFHFRFRLNGAPPTVERFGIRDPRTVAAGDIVKLVSGQVEVAATGDAGLLGVALEAQTSQSSQPVWIQVVTDADAVYGVIDDNSRVQGDGLGLTGATGAQGVTAGADRDFSVVARSSAADETTVRIAEGRHAHDRPTGGHLNAAIARSVVRIYAAHVGRGPTKAQAFYHRNVVVVVVEDFMTKAERSLVASAHHEAVLALRRQFQQTMQADLRAAVEGLTGCQVTALMSDGQVDPDMAVEVFVLDRPVPGERAAPGAGPSLS